MPIVPGPVPKRVTTPPAPITPDEATALLALLDEIADLRAKAHGRADLKRALEKLRRLSEMPSR